MTRSRTLPSAVVVSLVTLLLGVWPAAALTLDAAGLRGSLTIDKRKPNRDRFTVSAFFAPAAGATPDLAALPVTVAVGSFSAALPAGALIRSTKGTKTMWSFKGPKGGLGKLTIVRPGTGAWTIEAKASGIDLADTTNPVGIALTIGDDQGTLPVWFAVTADSSTRRVMKYPAGPKGDADGDGMSPVAGDCDDQNPTVFSGAPERCDGEDDDCDDAIDEGFDLGATCTAGLGACRRDGVTLCGPDGNTTCGAAPGTPGTELCGNAVDDDCDGETDEGFALGVPCTIGTGACEQSGITICAPDGTGTVCDAAPDPSCSPGPAVAIVDPPNLSSFNTLLVPVSGTVSADAVQVKCNAWIATIENGSFHATLILEEGTNVIACVASDAAGHTRTAAISVTVDTQPPRVAITAPADGATLVAAATTVSGLVNDVVVGTVNQQEAQVVCNGVAAAISNRTFLASGVPLVPGTNVITCAATDEGGNADSAHVTVTRATPSGPAIHLVSGDGQTAEVGTTLPQPLVLEVSDGGAPIAGAVVVFDVLRNDGTVHDGTRAGRLLALETGADGRAAVDYTLGTWAGAGNSQVRATAPDAAGEVVFISSATPGPATRIVVDAGNNQEGAVDERLPLPFVAVVIDGESNRLAGVPVRFRVTKGGGNLGGAGSVVVETDSDGRAQAVLTLGPEEAADGNVVVAGFDGNAGTAAVFVATGKIPGDPADTSLSGVVLDNTDTPIAGVTVGIEDPASPINPRALLMSVQTDAEGQFTLAGIPVGHVIVRADGATAQRPGIWPRLDYDLVTIAGRRNTLGMPIYLLPIDMTNGLLVDDTTGGTITLPHVPGFALTIVPGSVTFINGGHRGTVSVTTVHPDKVPMVPSFGQQPRMIVTIQPPGVHFNPPAAMTIPNTDGYEPGQKTELYSFDHDLGQFVSIGPATVSDDGSVIVSDPGVGVIKGGWHSSGNPPPPGDVGTCDDGNPCTNDVIVLEPCQGDCTSQMSCRNDEMDGGEECEVGDPTGVGAVRCRDDFVDVQIADSCATDEPGEQGFCQTGVCIGSGVFSSEAIFNDAVEAFSKFCGQTPCVGDPLGLIMRTCARDNGIRFKCNNVNTGACAVTPIPAPLAQGGCLLNLDGTLECANEIELRPSGVNPDGCGGAPPPSVILHEMVHALACELGSENHNSGPDENDIPYGCEAACYPDSTSGGNAEVCK